MIGQADPDVAEQSKEKSFPELEESARTGDFDVG
jgi:hypothetical protein